MDLDMMPPMWFMPAPPGYPWADMIFLPPVESAEHGARLVEAMKNMGNDALKAGSAYDALWKYSHALELCKVLSLNNELAVLHGNCAQACLTLERYPDVYIHASSCIYLDPNSDKAYFRRAEAIRRSIMSGLGVPGYLNMESAVADYIQCHRIKQNALALSEAIIAAIDYNLTQLLPILVDRDIQSGFSTRLLHEMISNPAAQSRHIQFLVMGMRFNTRSQHFNCTLVKLSDLVRKLITDKPLLIHLFNFGLRVEETDLKVFVDVLPDIDSSVEALDLILSRYSPPGQGELDRLCQAAMKGGKKLLGACFMKYGAVPIVEPQEMVARIKDEGNSFFKEGSFHEALGKYYRALELCSKYGLQKDMAIIRANCAQVCLKLKLYKDAYEHADESVQLNPDLEKAYYRRAEALKGMLLSPELRARVPNGRGFADAVRDYCRVSRNTTAFVEAVLIAVNYDCTSAIPTLKDADLVSMASLLTDLLDQREAKPTHVQFLLFKLRVSSASLPCYDTTGIELSALFNRGIRDDAVIARLLDLGVVASEADCVCLIDFIPDSKGNARTLTALMDRIRPSRDVVAGLCRRAMNARKVHFIAALLDAGAEPDPGELKSVIGWPHKTNNPVFSQYFKRWERDDDFEVAGRMRAPPPGFSPYNHLHPEFHPPQRYDPEFDDVYPPPPPKNKDDPHEIVKILNGEGKKFWKQGNYTQALEHYNIAYDVCQRYNLLQDLLVILGNLAQVYLKMELFEQSYTFATMLVKRDPKSEKGFFRRAEALRLALVSGRSVPPLSLSYADAVDDYCKSHRLKSNVRALCEAIVIGVDHDCSQMILEAPSIIHMEDVQTNFCRKLFDELISRSDCKQEHLKFYVLRVLSGITFSASSVSLSRVLLVPANNKKLIRRLIDCQIVVKATDVQTAVEQLPDTCVDVLKLIIDASGGELEHVEKYFKIAASAKKLKIVTCLLEYGANPKVISIDLICHALEKGDRPACDKLWTAMKPNFDPEKVNICALASTTLADHPDFLRELLDAGVDPNGSGKKRPLTEIVGLTYLVPAKRNALVAILLEKGADCQQLCLTSKASTTTPLHIVTKMALEAGGDCSVLDALVTCPTYQPPGRDGRVVDENGKTPFHLAVQSHFKRDISAAVLTALIEKHKVLISPFVRDRAGKQARDYIHKKDDLRVALLDKAAGNFQSPAKGGKGKKKKKKKASQPRSVPAEEKEEEPIGATGPSKEAEPDVSEAKPESRKPSNTVKPEQDYEKCSFPHKLDRNMKRLLSIGVAADYFRFVPREEPEDGEEASAASSTVVPRFVGAGASRAPVIVVDDLSTPSVQLLQDDTSPRVHLAPGLAPEVLTTPSTTSGSEMDEVVETTDMNDLFLQYGFGDFDELPWEVEVTAKVTKFFKDVKANSKAVRVSAVRAIHHLAEGRRGVALAKPVGGVSGLHLYRAKMNKGGRILWEKAVQFSPRQTGSHDTPIYSQVIRIWDIVPAHDHMQRCIEQIEFSFTRGRTASLNYALLPHEISNAEAVRGRETLEIPRTFILHEDSLKFEQGTDHFVPAASLKDDEYNVTYFYSFSSAMVKSILTRPKSRRELDFPFKEWPKEHEIINLQAKESILLLGRSGTGKTTCCLYRLWNEFKFYWDPVRRHPDAKIPRKSLIPIEAFGGEMDQEEVEEEEEEKESKKSEEVEEEEEEEEEGTAVSGKGSLSSLPLDLPGFGADDEGLSVFECESEERLENKASHHCDTSLEEQVSDAPKSVSGLDEVYEDLHQVFVTKNYVLCAQMKKRFFNLATAHEYLTKHVEFQDNETKSLDVPNSLTLVKNLSFPLFLTARQFYILLDNSLHDSKNFFPRGEDGSLKVKILSTDYDHEDADTLLDLEESDEELDDENIGQLPVNQLGQLKQAAVQQVPMKWREVTSLYFKEHVWPAIKHRCGEASRSFDPLLVWTEIQSFIKGSERALRKGLPLSLDEYTEVGNRMAPNFSRHRVSIFKAFTCYREYCQNQRHNVQLFDECDLVQSLYHRLCELKDVPWSIHCFFIDEVQDFTQAELSVFLHCCRDPNSLFFTGDTAQSIMRGIAFRFQDLRSLFYHIHRNVPLVKVPKKPYTLTVNFRSHSGVLKLAGSVIDLLTNFFRGSIDDHLPEDRGMFPGPIPVLIESCEVNDLSLLLSTNKREASAIEFGAHQVILVQSKDAKEKLPKLLQGAIVLTIFEAKGLEFDDVLLYNFFTDSLVDEKGWRVVTSYLESHPSYIVNHGKIPGYDKAPRSLEFDKSRHMSLSSELKYLYTAITRAKCNLWIYDSHKEKRLPIFDYWYKRCLVKVVGMEGSLMDGEHGLIFASISTEDQWKVQGDYFKKKHLWEQARHCYLRSGPDYDYLAQEAKAFVLIQQARQHGRVQNYLEAAVYFLECDDIHHDARYMKWAALCLMNTRPPRYTEAAKLFERLGERARAFRAFRKAKDAENCARLREEDGRYSEAVRILDIFNKKMEALAKATDFERREIQIEPDVQVNELSYLYAKRYARTRDKRLLCDVLEYMTDIPRRARFYKEGGLSEKAFEVYKSQKQIKEAFRLATAQMATCSIAAREQSKDTEYSIAKDRKAEEWFCKAIFLAESEKDEKMQAILIFQKVKLDFVKLSKMDSVYDVDEIKELEIIRRSHKDEEIRAHANLVLGQLLKDVPMIRTANRTYLKLRHRIGELEAFNLLVEREVEESVRTVLDTCHLVAETQKLLSNPDSSANAKQVTQQALAFFNLHKIGDEYLTPQLPEGKDEWLGDIFKGCEAKEKDKLLPSDLDGMQRLDVSAVKDRLVKRYENFEKKWFKHYEAFLRRQILQRVSSFRLHKEIESKRALSRVYSPSEVVAASLSEYITNCIHDCELAVISSHCKGIGERTVVPFLLRILTIFSPQVAMFIPLRNIHVALVRKSQHLNALLKKWIRSMIREATNKDKENFDMDLWLMIWRVACLVDGNMTLLYESLEKQADIVNDDRIKFIAEKKETASSSDSPAALPSSSHQERSQPGSTETTYSTQRLSSQKSIEPFQPPPAFHYWRDDDRCNHLFFYWLQACDFMKKGQASYSSRCVVKYFLLEGHKANISVMNLVNMFALHTTSLLAILTHVNHLQNFQSSFRVPLLYRRIILLFDDLSTHTREDKFVMAACAEEVVAKHHHHRQFELARDCQFVLRMMLDVLLGYYSRYRILSYAFKHEDSIRSGAACNCLILTLTIFGNLLIIRNRPQQRSRPRSMEEYQSSLCSILNKVLLRAQRSSQTEALNFVVEALQVINRDDYRSNIFQLITNLLKRADSRGRLTYLQLRPGTCRSRVGFIEQDKFRPHLPTHPWASHHAHVSLPHHMPGSNFPRGPNFPPARPSAPRFSPHPPLQHQPLTFDPSHPNSTGTAGQVPVLSPTHSIPSLEFGRTMSVSTSVDRPPLPDERSQPSAEGEVTATAQSPGPTDPDSSEPYAGGEDEDLNQALSRAQQSKKDAPREENPMSALTVVEKHYCFVCSIPLRSDEHRTKEDEEEEAEGQAIPTVDSAAPGDDSIESYSEHIKCEKHVKNATLYHKSRTEQEERYNPLLKEVGDMLAKCRVVDAGRWSSTLARLVDDMEEQRQKNESRVDELTVGRSYEEMIHEIDTMCDRMHHRLTLAELEYKKLDLSDEQTKDATSQVLADPDEVDEDSILPEKLDEALALAGDEPVAGAKPVMRSQQGKMQSRERKKKRRK